MRATANTATVRNYPVIGREFEVVMHEAANAARTAKGAAWLCTAPFIGLAYVVALPLAGLGALAWFALKALAARWKTAARVARNLALFFVAPFVGLAYALAFPVVGLGMLAWWALHAATRRGAAR